MSRLYPVSYGAGVLLVSDLESPARDERIVRPPRRKEGRHARI